jgi:hypothetical protein
MKKIILPGIVTGVAMLVAGMAVSFLFMIIPAVAGDYANANLMRSWSDPLMSLFFLYPFVLGFAFAWVWNKTKNLFKGNVVKRGFRFAVAYLIIATIPGMLISYSSFPTSFWTMLSWTVSGFADAFVAGIILAKMNK